ncbi:arylamine N-acetyltransferase family protein [Tenacibaculum ovolyticum]|uniref:arylamine N-acetyltransferase family protein n=1 Tax=Tenacibaculum ovolyticum TaxID=104270 RepID=UPI001F18580D|nr:arylamine N-acetyltransferase [Tenacibaculum ovolyticum]
MNVQKYLDRINFERTIDVSQECLFQLQKSHLLSVPFENLDIHYGNKINLNINNIYQKVVINKRGGFCYELNGLFYQLLKNLGFNVKLISAQVHIKDNEYSPEYDHLAIIALIDGEEFLVDVGFGKFSLEPLKVELDLEILDSFGKFQFSRCKSNFFRISEIKKGKLYPSYIFTTKERELSDFRKRCHFHQTDKHSHFKRRKLISIAETKGRITLTDNQLKISNLGVEKVINFGEEVFEDKLEKYFNIKISKR